jgi:nucleoside-diphosphate-sugar epimerase
MPLSYVDNCADAIIRAGTTAGIEGEFINILDHDLRTCSQFLSGYKKEVKHLRSIPVPYPLFWLFSALVETYARYSDDQIPAVLSRYKTATTWKRCRFKNEKLTRLLSWSPAVSTEKGLSRHFRYYRQLYSD